MKIDFRLEPNAFWARPCEILKFWPVQTSRWQRFEETYSFHLRNEVQGCRGAGKKR
jgi:hypothetical protein